MSEIDFQIKDKDSNNIYPITKVENIKHETSNAKITLGSAKDSVETESSKIFNSLKSLQDALGNVKTSSGNAKPEDVLEGKTFSNKDTTNLTGIIKKRGNLVITPSKSSQSFDKGYYEQIKCNAITKDTVKNNLSDNDILSLAKEKMPELKPENIIKDVTIAGIIGTGKRFNIETGYIHKLRERKIITSAKVDGNKATLTFEKMPYAIFIDNIVVDLDGDWHGSAYSKVMAFGYLVNDNYECRSSCEPLKKQYKNFEAFIFKADSNTITISVSCSSSTQIDNFINEDVYGNEGFMMLFF